MYVDSVAAVLGAIREKLTETPERETLDGQTAVRQGHRVQTTPIRWSRVLDTNDVRGNPAVALRLMLTFPLVERLERQNRPPDACDIGCARSFQ